MSKNYIIVLLAGLLFIAIATRSCGHKTTNNAYIIDSLHHAIDLKIDTINTLEIQFSNISNTYAMLKEQKQKIVYETKIIWKIKPTIDSLINAYSDSETIRKFLLRYNTY